VFENDIMTGITDTQFSPNLPLTRAMIVTMLFRQEGSPSVSGIANPFNDVAAGRWYTDAIIWGAENGIVQGFGEGRFAPGENIRRQDLTTILIRYADMGEMDLPGVSSYTGFADSGTISAHAREAVSRGYEAGIVAGGPGNRFNPMETATRAEAAAMLVRLLQLR
ncbi:MAG: S-layer homology domain-containing protein, partial [Oscillospiraceae bacterium]|nr:S-layer homology domain-containing protein [Oscillospiraceae bacterium]